MHAHSHSGNWGTKIKIFLLSALIAVTSFSVLFTASIDEDESKKFDFSEDGLLKSVLLAFAALAALNIFVETKDHIFPHDHNHENIEMNLEEVSEDKELMPPTSGTPLIFHKESPLVRKSKQAGAAIVGIVFFGSAGYSLWLQGNSVSKACNVEHPLAKAALSGTISLPLGARFFFIPLKHLWHNLKGTENQFTIAVTGSIGPISCLNSKCNRALVFLFLAATHLAESFLLSNETEGGLGILSALSLAISTGFAHLDHVRALPNAWRQWRTQGASTQVFTALLGTISGVAHTAPGTLATIFYWGKTTPFVRAAMVISDFCDFGLGWLECQQHLGRRLFSQNPISEDDLNSVPTKGGHNRLVSLP